MSALQFFHPASVDEAIALLAASPLPVDSPTQRRIRGDTHLRDTSTSGRRRPGVGLGVSGTPTTRRRSAWSPRSAPMRPTSGSFVLDHFGLPDDPRRPRAGRPRDRRSGRGRGRGGRHLRADRRHPRRRGRSRRSPARCARRGRLLVERRHYEFEPPAADWATASDRLFLEQPTGPDDPRLAACHREVMRDTLDAHDAELIETVGLRAGLRARASPYLLDADPVECIRLATDAAGSLVGLVSGAC